MISQQTRLARAQAQAREILKTAAVLGAAGKSRQARVVRRRASPYTVPPLPLAV